MNKYILFLLWLLIIKPDFFCQKESIGNYKHRLKVMTEEGNLILDYIHFNLDDVDTNTYPLLRDTLIGKQSGIANIVFSDFDIYYIRSSGDPKPIYLQMNYKTRVGPGRVLPVPDTIDVLGWDILIDTAKTVSKNCIKFIENNYDKTKTRLDNRIILENELDKSPITRPVNPDFYFYQETFTEYIYPKKIGVNASLKNSVVTDIKVYKGGRDETQQWTIFADPPPAEKLGLLDTTGNTYTFTLRGMTSNYEAVNFKAARKNGTDTLSQTFSISRSLSGDDYYLLELSSLTIIESNNRTSFTPPLITVNAKKQDGIQNYYGYFRILAEGAVAGSQPYTSNQPENSADFTIPNGSTNIKVQLYSDANFNTLLDEETIPVVSANQSVMILTNRQQKLPVLNLTRSVISGQALDIDFTGISLSFTSLYYVKDYPFGIQLTSKEKILNILPIQNLSVSLGARLLLPLSTIGSGTKYNTINYDTVSNLDLRFLYRYRWNSKKILNNPFFYADSPTLNLGEGFGLEMLFSQIDKRLPSLSLSFFAAQRNFTNPYTKFFDKDHFTAYHSFIQAQFLMSFYKSLDEEHYHNLRIDIGAAFYNVFEANYAVEKENILSFKRIHGDINPVFSLNYFFQMEKPKLGLSTRIYEERLKLNFWLKLFEITEDHEIRLNCLYLSPPLFRSPRAWENDGGAMIMFNYRYGFLK